MKTITPLVKTLVLWQVSYRDRFNDSRLVEALPADLAKEIGRIRNTGACVTKLTPVYRDR